MTTEATLVPVVCRVCGKESETRLPAGFRGWLGWQCPGDCRTINQYRGPLTAEEEYEARVDLWGREWMRLNRPTTAVHPAYPVRMLEDFRADRASYAGEPWCMAQAAVATISVHYRDSRGVPQEVAVQDGHDQISFAAIVRGILAVELPGQP